MAPEAAKMGYRHKGLIIAIDGVVGAGKTTTARLVAAKMGYRHLDTGAMYRAITLAAMRQGVEADDLEQLAELVDKARITLETGRQGSRVLLDGEDVSDQIRRPEVSRKVGAYADVPLVRQALVKHQQQMGASGGVVAEGRDVGTVVFPDAKLKVCLVAALSARVDRRYRELIKKGVRISIEQVEADIRQRDLEDQERDYGAKGDPGVVLELDNTAMSVDEQVNCIVHWALQRGG